ncbi:MAG: cobalamin-dependent protein [Pseudomonadota bacterium]
MAGMRRYTSSIVGPIPARRSFGTLNGTTEVAAEPPGAATAIVARTLAETVIPNLMDNFGAEARRPAQAVSDTTVVAFVDHLMSDEGESAFGIVRELMDQGATTESLCIRLFEPAAHRLGRLWESDQADFVAVTIAAGRIQQVLHRCERLEPPTAASDRQPHALLLPAPGDQHGLGVAVVASFLARAGWNVTIGAVSSPAEVAKLVHEQWFAIAGFSLGAERDVELLRATIEAARETSCNPKIGILVGGPVVAGNATLAATVGADGTAADGLAAVRIAARWATQH